MELTPALSVKEHVERFTAKRNAVPLPEQLERLRTRLNEQPIEVDFDLLRQLVRSALLVMPALPEASGHVPVGVSAALQDAEESADDMAEALGHAVEQLEELLDKSDRGIVRK